MNFVELVDNMVNKIANLVSHKNLNVQFLRLNKTYPQPDLLPNPNPGGKPPGSPVWYLN